MANELISINEYAVAANMMCMCHHVLWRVIR